MRNYGGYPWFNYRCSYLSYGLSIITHILDIQNARQLRIHNELHYEYPWIELWISIFELWIVIIELWVALTAMHWGHCIFKRHSPIVQLWLSIIQLWTSIIVVNFGYPSLLTLVHNSVTNIHNWIMENPYWIMDIHYWIYILITIIESNWKFATPSYIYDIPN